jgi:hypothetical protein
MRIEAALRSPLIVYAAWPSDSSPGNRLGRTRISFFLSVPTNENGVIVDPNIDTELRIAANEPFAFTDVFIYSHGWWNTASSAASEYNIFTIGCARMFQVLATDDSHRCRMLRGAFSPLVIGIYWPSMISENQNSVSNFLEATTFFTMQQRADGVGRHAGYSLLRALIEARRAKPLRFNLIGHSFGCRVVLSALQAIANDADLLEAANPFEFNVVLLQAAADADSLAQGHLYGNIQSEIRRLRMLVTVSTHDIALGTWYPRAQELAHLFSGPTPAIGATGPLGNLLIPVAERLPVSSSSVPCFSTPLVVADLSPLHEWHKTAYGSVGWAGQHSDINLPQIYELLALFFGGP